MTTESTLEALQRGQPPASLPAAGAQLQLPLIDVAPLRGDDADAKAAVAHAMRGACHEWSFFYVTGAAVGTQLLNSRNSGSSSQGSRTPLSG